jgi:chromosome segregation ATPase
MAFRKNEAAGPRLEQVAAKLTLYGRSLRAQLRALQLELGTARGAIVTSEDDLDESEARLEEIEELMASHQEEIDHLRASAGDQTLLEDDGSLQARCEELDELLDERDEELQLLEHIRSVLRMQQLSRAKLQVRIAGLTRELAKVRRGEEAVVLVALRTRLVKMLPPKA